MPESSLQTLKPFLRPHRRSMVIALLLMFTEVLVELSYPLLLARLIDEGIMLKDTGTVLFWGLLMVLLALLSFVCGISSTFFASDAGQSCAHDLRAALFRRMNRAPLRVLQDFPTATLLTRLTSDVNRIQTAVFMCVRLYLRTPLLICGSILLALLIDFELAFVLVLIAPVVGLLLAWTLERGMRLFRLAQEQLDRTTGLVRENLIGMPLIRAYSRRDHELSRFAEASQSFMQRTAAAMRLSEMMVPSLILLMNFCILVVLWSGSHKIAAEGISPGEVVAILNYAVRIIGEFAYVSMILTNLSMARSALGRAAEILESDIESGEVPAAGVPAASTPVGIRFEHAGFRYPGSAAPVLHDLSFAVGAGETVVIVGSTGSGKTSLLHLLIRFFDPSTGRVLVDGRDIREWPVSALRQRIGYVPQTPMLVSGSIRDNLRWGQQDASDEDIVAAAKSAQIHDLILNLPEGYETRLDQRGTNLSGGQRQRLAIARALVRRPGLLLLDDCTSALDAKTEARLLAALRKQDCTILFATQKIVAARQADAVLLLENGQLSAYGHHEDMLQQSGTYREIAASQAPAGELLHA